MLRRLVGFVVAPIVAKLDDADGGPAFLAICAELSVGTFYPLAQTPACAALVVAPLAKAILDLAGPMPMALMLLRKARIETMIFQSIAQYVHLCAHGVRMGRDVFVADLVATIAALVAPSDRDLHLS